MSHFIVVEGNLHNFNQQHFLVVFLKGIPVENKDVFCITTNEEKARIIADALNIFIEGIEENETSL